MVIFESVRFQNFLSTGNLLTEVTLNSHNNTLICGINGSGKCLDPLTTVDIKFKNKKTEKKFKKFLKKK